VRKSTAGCEMSEAGRDPVRWHSGGLWVGALNYLETDCSSQSFASSFDQQRMSSSDAAASTSERSFQFQRALAVGIHVGVTDGNE